MSAHFDFAYDGEPDIPEGMTIREWRSAGRPTVCSSVAGASLRPEPEQGLVAPVAPLSCKHCGGKWNGGSLILCDPCEEAYLDLLGESRDGELDVDVDPDPGLVW